jgi:hypothetical protein
MSRVLELSDDEYTRLEQAARQRGSTIDELVRSWIDGMSAFPSDQKIREAQARWAVWGESIVQPTPDELRAHPLLRVAGVFNSGSSALADLHDEIIAEEALNPHSDE